MRNQLKTEIKWFKSDSILQLSKLIIFILSIELNFARSAHVLSATKSWLHDGFYR